MKLNFNFSGKTLLKDWWGIVRDDFLEVQNGHNSLKAELDNEAEERKSSDNSLNSAINNEAYIRQKADEANLRAISAEQEEREAQMSAETSARKSEDAKLRESINAEITARNSAQTELESLINGEISRSSEADTAMRSDILSLQENSHTHGNKSVIDAITADDVDNWNGIKPQVTKTELDSVTAYSEEMSFSLTAQLIYFMSALGITAYDGGWFGMEQREELDGGAFGDGELTPLDCGGFEAPVTVSVIDGGNY